MTSEEYQRIKEAEKAHLRKLKELKQAVRQLERQRSVTEAMEQLTSSQDTLDENAAMVEQLAIETARQEARLEIALEEAEQQAEATDEELEEEMVKLRAQNLLRRMKQEGASPKDEERSGHSDDDPVQAHQPDAPKASSPEPSEHPTPPPEDDLPEKTIGRMQ